MLFRSRMFRRKIAARLWMMRTIFFHLADMAVLPEPQRRGIGDAILTALIDRIRAAAPPKPYITLLADAPGRRLYARYGFVETAPQSIGMKL